MMILKEKKMGGVGLICDAWFPSQLMLAQGLSELLDV
jgi:hypothetical protein